DKKHEIFDEDLQALVSESSQDESEIYKLAAMRVCSETGEQPVATLTLNVDGEEHVTRAEGAGPVDASFRAIEALVGSGAKLQLYSVNNITSGTDSQGEVTVRLEKEGRIVNGLGADIDIVKASIKAYLNALNKLASVERRPHPQHGDV
ncbi:MAG TPA: 2-isopropylmalate synthase, partial [Gammaproteobacteria bacterium]|nr:2-isopropylmalate synthase [Gammaproteobacteria bacterium]